MGNIAFSNLVEQQDNCPAIAQTLNKREITSIRSLILYTADTYKKDEALIEAVTLKKFKADNVINIERRYFDEAIRYLVDLKFDETVN